MHELFKDVTTAQKAEARLYKATRESCDCPHEDTCGKYTDFAIDRDYDREAKDESNHS